MAARSPVRIAAVPNSGWPGRRLTSAAVSVAPGIPDESAIPAASRAARPPLAADRWQRRARPIRSRPPDRWGCRRSGTRCRRGTAADAAAGSSGEAVDSESGDELGDALAVPPSSAICAGISDAEVSLSWVIANAPEPIGSPPNGSWSSEFDGQVAEQVDRGDRLGQGLQEAAQWRVEGEPHLVRVDRADGDLRPRRRRWAGVGRVLQGLDGEDDVIRGDGRAVVPPSVRPDIDGPRLAGLVDGPALG